MAYTTPPTFNTSDALTATQLNILSDDIEYLYGYVVAINPAMANIHLDADGDALFVIRHTQRYLHIRYQADDRCRVYYDSTKVYDVSGSSGDTNATIDLNSYGFVVGQLYTLKFTLASTAQPLNAYYAYEAIT